MTGKLQRRLATLEDARRVVTATKDDMQKPIIVKVQRPLSSSANDPPWLVSDQTRAINEFVAVNDVPSSVVKAMGTAAKAYFHVVRDADGRLIFGSPAAAQPW
jgi:hypothetical protein